jgi:hypothetical protein
MAGGTRTWETRRLKLDSPCRRACQAAIALAGAVVSKPMAKNTTRRRGFAAATRRASSGEYTTRMSAPSAFRRRRSPREPGTRSMSPNEQKMTSGREAIAWARSIISSEVTHTGQPGPWSSSTSEGRTWSIPYLTMVWVWPPQTSMSVHGRVTAWRMARTIRSAASPSRYSSTNFIAAAPPAP